MLNTEAMPTSMAGLLIVCRTKNIIIKLIQLQKRWVWLICVGVVDVSDCTNQSFIVIILPSPRTWLHQLFAAKIQILRFFFPPPWNLSLSRQRPALYYIILHYTALYYIILHYTVLYYYIILHYIALYYIILHYTTLYCIILYYTAPYYIIHHYNALYYIILHYTN